MKIPIFMFHKIGEVRGKYWMSKEMLFTKLQTLHSLGYQTMTCQDLADGKICDNPCILTFDDAYENFLQAVPILNRFGMKATVFVPTGFIGNTNTWEKHDIKPIQHLHNYEIQELSGAGFDFQPHGAIHQNLLGLSAERQRIELKYSKSELESLVGTERSVFCYPGGGYSPEIKTLVKEFGYKLAISCDEGIENTHTMDKFAVKRLSCHSEIL